MNHYAAKFDWENRLKSLKSKYTMGIIWFPEVADEFARLLMQMLDDWQCWDFVKGERWKIVYNPYSGYLSVISKETEQEMYWDFYERLNFSNLPKFYKKKK